MIEWVSAEPAPPGYRCIAARRIQAGWLVCHRLQPGDAPELSEAVMVSLDHLRPWMPWARDYTPQVAAEFMERHGGQADQTPVADALYVIRDRRGRLLGGCGLHARLGVHRLEIGYWVDVRHTRRGVATLACAALTELALTIPELRWWRSTMTRPTSPARPSPPSWAMRTWRPATTLRTHLGKSASSGTGA